MARCRRHFDVRRSTFDTRHSSLRLALPAGLSPATRRFEAARSDALSYGSEKKAEGRMKNVESGQARKARQFDFFILPSALPKLGPAERLALSWGACPAVYETAAVAAEPRRREGVPSCRLQVAGPRHARLANVQLSTCQPATRTVALLAGRPPATGPCEAARSDGFSYGSNQTDGGTRPTAAADWVGLLELRRRDGLALELGKLFLAAVGAVEGHVGVEPQIKPAAVFVRERDCRGVRRVAEKYFGETNRTVGWFVPTDGAGKRAPKASAKKRARK